MSKKLIAALVLLTALIGGILIVVLVQKQRLSAELADKTRRLNDVCVTVRGTLVQNAREIRADTNLKDSIKERVYGYYVGDSVVTLEACLPEAFPIDDWRACVFANDDECLVQILEDAARAVHVDAGTRRWMKIP